MTHSPYFFDGRGIGKGTRTKLEKFLTAFLFSSKRGYITETNISNKTLGEFF